MFESNTSDETELSSIICKAKVVCKEEFDMLSAAQRSDNNGHVYFCRYHYDPTRQRFMPILQSLKKASLGGLEAFKAQGVCGLRVEGLRFWVCGLGFRV